MTITPNSKIILLKCPLELNDENQLTFSSATDQYNYFNGLNKLEYENMTYIRKDNIVRIETNDELTFEDILKYNYCMYQNTAFDNKWFYAYITDYNWINPGLTTIKLETDVFQSWQFDIVYQNSFIEREHVTDDTIGAHTISEGLEKGEFIPNTSGNIGVGGCHAVVVTNYDVVNKTSVDQNIIGGVYSGYIYYLVQGYDIGTSVSFIDWLVDAVVKDADLDPSMIQGIYMVPDSMTGYFSHTDQNFWRYASGTGGLQYAGYHILKNIEGATIMQEFTIGKQTTLNGYSPKNNKLLTGEYNYLLIDNNGGNSQIYNYEYFSESSCTFKTKGVISPGCSIKLIPYSYKNLQINYSECLNLVKLPVGSWSCDMYTNWLTQNSINVMGINLNTDDLNDIKTGLQLGSNLALGNPVNIANTGLEIANNLIERKQHKRIPPQTFGNTNSGDITYALGQSSYTIYKMTIKQEYARILDDYFEHYGYKVNSFKTLSITGRPYWNYVKTIDVNLGGDIPSNDMIKLKELFNRGCTFWHTTTYFKNYTLNNH